MKLLSLFLIVMLMGCSSTTPVKEDLGYQGQNNSGLGVNELLSQLKSNPEVNVRVERGWQIAEVKSERALYSFTPESHPAHPSYVKREVVEKGGSIYIETSARCGAEKTVCDQLIRDFVKLNNKVKEDIGAE
ncbi:molecular chaperone DnaJ [Pseudoalteromonas sp. SG44-1]|uniref:molecular chaperone DnaJ n=1 Tax=Pseudoalteromonas TaxID=53246 RepID=UPI0015FF61C8|nr:molecular chaperone DnaJ [Pseudoalteromonas sp. SG44-1]MBB1415647.1 molecular chaperone DnaJ [Pseudoalteromonas sp. SG44-1]